MRFAQAIIIALLVAGCGGRSEQSGSSAETAAAPAHVAQAQPGHIHGLGLSRGTLVIATHSGLFRAPADSLDAQRIGTSAQDTMGFTVVGKDHFLGSGHPAPGDNRPPLLGLIESRDGGRNWRSVSLLGEADFHVLRSAGRRVYGVDAANGRLLVSGDEGRHWREGALPNRLIDLVPDPARPGAVLASTEHGLLVSRDAARSWRPLARIAPGLLAWPRGGAAVHVDGSGRVTVSSAGKRWAPRGRLPGSPVALAATGANELYAALGDGTVLGSRDGGASWRPRARL
jgi:hypothetical protein